MASISENIKMLRESKRWTKVEMAQRLGLKSYSTVSRWETGDNHPRGSDLKDLCKLFGVSADFLLGIEDMNDEKCINYYKYYPVSVSAGSLESIDFLCEDDIKWMAIEDDIMGKYAGSNDIIFMDVSGTSMNKIINPGSRIGIKKIDNFRRLKDGDIVLFSKENEFSIKRFYYDHTYNRLIFRPESTDDFHIDIVVPYSEAHRIVVHGKVVINIAQY